MKHAILAALIAAALLAGCGGDDDRTGARTSTGTSNASSDVGGGGERTDTINIEDFTYAPMPATVQAGQKIAIANADAAPHTLTHSESPRAFDSGTIEGKATGSLMIDKAGTYSYFCEFHPFMKGEITVTE